jgi:hypothetical protein
MICIPSQILLSCSNEGGDERSMWRVKGRREGHKDIWWGSLKKGDNLEDL